MLHCLFVCTPWIYRPFQVARCARDAHWTSTNEDASVEICTSFVVIFLNCGFFEESDPLTTFKKRVVVVPVGGVVVVVVVVVCSCCGWCCGCGVPVAVVVVVVAALVVCRCCCCGGCCCGCCFGQKQNQKQNMPIVQGNLGCITRTLGHLKQF